MSVTNIRAIVLGLALIGGIAWFYWGPRKSGVRAPLTSSGYQEAMILVKGGYTSDVIVEQHGKPVRFNFCREEKAACSEVVVFNDFGKSA
jgi:plastocyanin domain-containing protein